MVIHKLPKLITIADYVTEEQIQVALAKYSRQYVAHRLSILESQVTLATHIWAPQRYPMWLRELLSTDISDFN